MLRALIGACLIALTAGPALADGIEPGKPAPAFTATDSTGQAQSLAQHKGKYVVLEWLNHGCPYVRKHYDSGNMQALQKAWTDKGVVWLSVISSAEGKQGHSTPEKAEADRKTNKAHPSAILLDPEGKLGQLYGARTTPQMVVIDPEGTVLYSGAIDDKASADADDIKEAKNYVAAALTAALAGQPVAEAVTRPYGCSVKYK